MLGQDRWLVIRAGRYRLAAPVRQVQGVLDRPVDVGTDAESAHRVDEGLEGLLDAYPHGRGAQELPPSPDAASGGTEPVLAPGAGGAAPACGGPGEAAAAGGVWIRVRRGEALRSVRVSGAEEMLLGPELVPLPLLLRRALGEATPLLGAVLLDNGPVLVVDLQRCIP